MQSPCADRLLGLGALVSRSAPNEAGEKLNSEEIITLTYNCRLRGGKPRELYSTNWNESVQRWTPLSPIAIPWSHYWGTRYFFETTFNVNPFWCLTFDQMNSEFCRHRLRPFNLGLSFTVNYLIHIPAIQTFFKFFGHSYCSQLFKMYSVLNCGLSKT